MTEPGEELAFRARRGGPGADLAAEPTGTTVNGPSLPYLEWPSPQVDGVGGPVWHGGGEVGRLVRSETCAAVLAVDSAPRG